MKPHRVKRVDPQSRHGEFSFAARGWRGVGDPLTGPFLCCATRAAWCTFSAVECHDRFCGGHKPGGKVARPLGDECYRPSRWTRCGTEDACRVLWASGRSGVLDLGRTASQGAVTAPRTRVRLPWDASGQWRIGRSSTRPVLKHGPRSLTCARVMGSVRNPKAQ